MSKRNRRFWSKNSEQVLIDLWRENKRTLQIRKDTAILQHIAEQMQQIPATKCSNFTVLELKHKFNNFTKKYRFEKSLVKRTGEPSSWPHYQDLQELVDGCEGDGNSNQFSTHESSSCESSADETSPTAVKKSPSSCLTAASPSDSRFAGSAAPVTAAEKKRNFQDTILRNLENMRRDMLRIEAELKQSSEELLTLEQKKIDLLEKYVTDAATVKTAFLEYIMKQ